jgi:hypothetical protein
VKHPTKPNPGSDAAREMGCKCPVLDNNHGLGHGPFWVNETCPVHGKPTDGGAS